MAWNHRRAVAQHCINGDSLSQWRRAKFDPPQNGDPWINCQKIWHSWLRPGGDPLCQILCKSVHGGLLGKCVKYNLNFSDLYLFFIKSPTGQTTWWIFTHNGSNDAVSPKDVPFWGYKVQNQYLIREKSRKRWKFDQKQDLEIFRPNTACSEIFISKLPLIVLVAP